MFITEKEFSRQKGLVTIQVLLYDEFERNL